MQTKQKRFISGKCEPCGRCVIECTTRYTKAADILDSIAERLSIPNRLSVKIKDDKPSIFVCQNCEEPKCMESCAFNAIAKNENGNVIIDQNKCVGCWACITVCPFRAVFKDAKRKVAIICDDCSSYADMGCVKACPKNAIVC